MKKYRKYEAVFMMLILTSFFTSTVLAHPPVDMEINYDIESQQVTVMITHETPGPTVHYINRVTIEVNDNEILSEDYQSQPTNDVFSYTYDVSAEIGDVITVTAYCNIQGSISRSLTIRDPSQDEPPVIEIKNPTKGYFHFSGIRLFATYFDLIYDTMGFGGFRVRPVQVFVDDDIDAPEDVIVNIYIDDVLRDTAIYNANTGYHELKWTGPRLGVFTLKATAEDTQGNTAETSMDVWYFCFVPE